jgi:hypothetical protein
MDKYKKRVIFTSRDMKTLKMMKDSGKYSSSNKKISYQSSMKILESRIQKLSKEIDYLTKNNRELKHELMKSKIYDEQLSNQIKLLKSRSHMIDNGRINKNKRKSKKKIKRKSKTKN